MKKALFALFLLFSLVASTPALAAGKPVDEKVGDPPYGQLQALVKKGLFKQAKELLVQSRARWPAQIWHANMGAVLIRLGAMEAAADELEAALEADQTSAAIWRMLKAVRSHQARTAYKTLFPTAAPPQPVAIALLKPSAKRKGVNWREQVLTALDAWRRAWSAQDVDAYLASYVADYRPPSGMSHGAWVKLRRERLRRPVWIDVKVRHVEVEQLRPDRVRVRFDQSYASNTFRDTVRKQIDWVRTPQGWRIVREVIIQ